MSDQTPAQVQNKQIMELPALGKIPKLSLDLGNIRDAESRLIEAKTVNPSTYSDLVNDYNSAYRDLKRHLSSIGFAITAADKALEEAKADVLLDKYPEFMKDRPKSQDNADMRKAFLYKDEQYLLILERMNQLLALQSNFEGKIKVFENVCRFVGKQMDLILKSGMSNADYYVTSGRNK